MMVGHHTWLFDNHPKIVSTGVVGGPFEAKGNLTNHFDILYEDIWLKQNSFEQAQQIMMEEANTIALKKEKIMKDQVEAFISGDLINQITPTTFAAKTLQAPYLGVFSACATTTEGLALAAMMVNNNAAQYVLTGCSSHNAATERQYRYPTEYGGQKPPTSQWTVTGAGCGLISNQGEGLHITSATIGKVIDKGMTDPFHMGGAMAPAAVDTILTHFKERQLDASYYDLVITGDLGKIGSEICFELLQKNGLQLAQSQYTDCGVMIYKHDQQVFAGASGAACPAVVTYGYLWNEIVKGTYERVLVVATGALHSPVSIQQNQSIPCIAHAVSIEKGSDQK